MQIVKIVRLHLIMLCNLPKNYQQNISLKEMYVISVMQTQHKIFLLDGVGILAEIAQDLFTRTFRETLYFNKKQCNDP